jgi:outer membrane immunogenic protein
MSDPSMSYVVAPSTPTFLSSLLAPATQVASRASTSNDQVPNNCVIGIEGDLGWTNPNSSARTGPLCSGPPFRGQCGGVSVLTDNAFFQTEVNWLASVRRRLGYASSQWLLYGTGGVVFRRQLRENLNCTGIAPTFCTGGAQAMGSNASETRVGFVVHAGAEFKPAQNCIFGAEYLFYHFDGDGTSRAGWTTVATGAPAPF